MGSFLPYVSWWADGEKKPFVTWADKPREAQFWASEEDEMKLGPGVGCVLIRWSCNNKNTTGWLLKNRNLFLTFLEAGCLVRARFLVQRWPPSPCVLTWWRSSGIFFIKALTSFMRLHALNLITSQKTTSLCYHIGG